MHEKSLSMTVIQPWPDAARLELHAQLMKALQTLRKKIIVLDDDPTGTQTVHDVSVYTDWTHDTLYDAFRSGENMFYILTNSRSFSKKRTIDEHCAIAHTIVRAAKETGQDFIIVSRSDSTLRGHYPVETQTLREVLESETDAVYDGEILMPFFPEGGRYTIGDVHYVAINDMLIPAAETEFARDRTFGYRSSNLREYVIEKHEGRIRSENIVSIPLESLRQCDIEGIANALRAVKDFGKVIVNAVDYADVEAFVLGFIRALEAGKRFVFRTAAALPKILGGISDQPLLNGSNLVDEGNPNGGLIIVGSHVGKTTKQLEQLRQLDGIEFIEFDVKSVLKPDVFTEEYARVLHEEEASLRAGKTVALYTSRERLDAKTGNAEDDLRLSVHISNAVTGFVRDLTVRPRFIIAKGGITSSEVGTAGLHIKRARVMGQLLSGVPVWRTGPESKFPQMPYIIFPGNVGDENALYDAVIELSEEGDVKK